MSRLKNTYELKVNPRIRRELRTISKPSRIRIEEKIYALAQEPRAKGCEKLKGHDAYRLRVGDYRIIYTIDDGNRTVHVKTIGPRSNIYRKL